MITKNRIVAGAVLLVVLFWLADALIDVAFFSGESFLRELILGPSAYEIYIRSLVTAFILIPGIIMSLAYARRQQAELLLQEIGTRYRSLFEALPSALMHARIIYEDGRPKDFQYVSVNKALEAMAGAKDLEGKLVSEAIPGIWETDSAVLETYSRVTQTGKPEYSETFVSALGMWVAVSICGIDREHFAATFTNITERKQIEASLQDSEQRLSSIASAVHESIVMLDDQGKCCYWNLAAQHIFGYESAEVLGQYIGPLLTGNKVTERIDEAMKSLQSADGKTEEVEAHRKNGEVFPLEVSSATFQKNGKWYLVGIGRDITERKKAEQARIKMEEAVEQTNTQLEQAILLATQLAVDAEAANKAKSSFLASMSHEIRTPMNAILGMADLLGETPLTAEQQKYVKVFQSAGENLLLIINDILDISKIEAGRIEIEKTDFDMAELLDTLCDVMAIRAHEKHIELSHHITPDVPTHLIGDSTRLRQVFTNLIGNAIKFTERGGVSVSVELRDIRLAHTDVDEIELLCSVRDSGIGIPADKVGQLFQPFTQADSSTTRKYGGTGLGLAISKQLIELMGGHVWIKSEEGIGSTFHFTIKFEIQKGKRGEIKVNAPSLQGLRVLVIDDTDINRLILNSTLSSQGARVTEAAGSIEGFKEFQRACMTYDPYRLVMLDCRMPDMDGFEVMEKINRELCHHGAVVMMLSSDNRSGDIARAKKLGISSYLIKPIKRNDLLRVVADLLGQSPTPPLSIVSKEKPVEIELLQPLDILLVEDNADNTLLIHSFLKKTPYRIDTAENGQAAVERFKASKYDLVLMDVQMPVMDGYTATGEIRNWERSQGLEPTPIIALTAHAATEDEAKSIAAGCNGHLTKPIKKARLLQAILEFTQHKTKTKDDEKCLDDRAAIVGSIG